MDGITETSLNKISEFTCSHCSISSVRISRRGTALLSFLCSSSLTIDSRFHIPSGSLPLSGRSRLCHSAAAGGALDERQLRSLETLPLHVTPTYITPYLHITLYL